MTRDAVAVCRKIQGGGFRFGQQPLWHQDVRIDPTWSGMHGVAWLAAGRFETGSTQLLGGVAGRSDAVHLRMTGKAQPPIRNPLTGFLPQQNGGRST